MHLVRAMIAMIVKLKSQIDINSMDSVVQELSRKKLRRERKNQLSVTTTSMISQSRSKLNGHHLKRKNKLKVLLHRAS